MDYVKRILKAWKVSAFQILSDSLQSHLNKDLWLIEYCHIILTPAQPVGSGRPQRGSNQGPPDQKSRSTDSATAPPGGRGENV